MGQIEARLATLKDGQRIRIRTASPEDATSVTALMRDYMTTGEHNVSEFDEFDFDIATRARQIAQSAGARDDLCLVAADEATGEALGFLAFVAARSRRRTAHHGELGLGVASRVRNLGVGRALIEALIDWARQQPGIEKLELSVLGSNAAGLALYRSLGFREEGRRARHYKVGPGRYVDRVDMGLVLDHD